MPRQYSLENTHNTGIMAHINAGKATTTERTLYHTGINHKTGETHDGASTMDWMAQEQERDITITPAAATAVWRGTRINTIDIPGHAGFTAEAERSPRVPDGAITILDAKASVESQTETAWRQATTYGAPRIVFYNKMDATGADFLMSCKTIIDRLGAKSCPIQLPVSAESTFTGIVDTAKRKSEIYTDDLNTDIQEDDVPEGLKDLCEGCRSKLIDYLADYGEDFMMQVLEGEKPSVEGIKHILRIVAYAGDFFPVLYGSAYKDGGAQTILDAVIECLSSPLDVPAVKGTLEDESESEHHPSDGEPFAALASKTATDPLVGGFSFFHVYSGIAEAGNYILNSTKRKRECFGCIVQMYANAHKEISQVYVGDIAAAVGLKVTTTGDSLYVEDPPIILESMEFPEPVTELSLEPKTKTDQNKMSLALVKLAEEDPAFEAYTDQETGQTIIAGTGELHLDITIDRLRRGFKVKANVGQSMAAYRGTIRGTAECEDKCTKQSNGHEQYDHVWAKFEPQEEGKGFEFVGITVGGSVSREYIKSTEEGLRDALVNGIAAGYQVIDIKATLFDGSYHDVDSSEMAYKIAAGMALKAAAKKRNPAILEPIMMVGVATPNGYLGSVMGNVSSCRGAITDQEGRGNAIIVRTHIPLSKIFGYVTDLCFFIQGRGNHSVKLDHYAEAPKSTAEKIIKNNSPENQLSLL